MKKFFTLMIMAAAFLASCNNAAPTVSDGATGTNDSIPTGKIVLDNIMTRTSIRQFTDKAIPKDTLELLVKAGMAAPSAVNKQPWAFVVVTEKEVLDSLNANHPYANLKTATAAIIVCGNLDEALEGEAQEYWVQDCSAATENILLAAHGLGLGAVWCGVYPNTERIPAVKQVLALPENIMPLCIVTLGYPDENPEPKMKWNPDKVHYQRW